MKLRDLLESQMLLCHRHQKLEKQTRLNLVVGHNLLQQMKLEFRELLQERECT